MFRPPIHATETENIHIPRIARVGGPCIYVMAIKSITNSQRGGIFLGIFKPITCHYERRGCAVMRGRNTQA